MKTTSTEVNDLEQIREWMSADAWHKHLSIQTAEELLTGKGLLSFCVQDDKGPVFYVRFDRDNLEPDLIRVSTQFGPESEVSKRRVVVGLAKQLVPTIKEFCKLKKFRGAIYESINPKLVDFMENFGFRAAGSNDYVLTVEE